MNLQPELEDELIILKPLRDEDFNSLYEVAKDPLIWEQHPCSDRYKKEVYEEFFMDSVKSKGALKIIEKSSGKVIGSTRFERIINSDNAIEIGWSFLSRDRWGGKYNRAMKKLMIDYALQHVDHVIFYVGKENIRSQKAVEKLGGKILPKYKFENLVKDDSDITFRIGKDNWNENEASR